MNPTIIKFPSLTANPSDMSWALERMDARFTSPLSGTFQDIIRPGAYWTCSMSWKVLSYPDAQLLTAWAAQMSKGSVRCAMPNYAYEMQGTGDLASGYTEPEVNGGSQTGNTLALDGFAASSSDVLLPGDLIQIGLGSISFSSAPANTHALTFLDINGNSHSIGTGDGSTKIFNLDTYFYTGATVLDNGGTAGTYTTAMQHQLVMVTAAASSNSSGDVTVDIEPSLRFSPASGNSAIITAPTAFFAFSKPSSSQSFTAPRIAAISLALVEDINV